MLKIDPKYTRQATAAQTLEDLYEPLQNAIELEHATIPPYLTALFSLKPGPTRLIIHSVVIEEMMHMTIAANILNALGGTPDINKPGFVPTYPGKLPMGIAKHLEIHLQAYSPEVARDVFMVIEEPENKLNLKAAANAQPEYDTIGQFYLAIKIKILELAGDTLPGNPALQVVSPFFDANLLFPILTKEDAAKAIDIIVEQGEGTSQKEGSSASPLDAQGEIAHYYRFEELVRGRKLIPDPTAPHGYSFTGDPIPFNPADVSPLWPDTKAKDLQEGSEERRLLDAFNTSYYSLLSGLHDTFNGNPANLNNTIGIMYDMKLTAEKLCNTPYPPDPNFRIGPSFEYVNTLAPVL